MKQRGIRICRFDTTQHIPDKQYNYETVKATVLEAGRFSVFEATANSRAAAIFTRLCRDPELKITDLGFPWTGVEKKQ